MIHHKFTKEQLIFAIKNSRSIRQSLTILNISNQGGNYRVIHKAIKLYNIDISHFNGKSWNKNRKFGPKRNLDDYLSNKFPIQSHKLKLRLIAENIFQHICSNCNLMTWLDRPIPLELDHINGNHLDNNLNNLRLLCPNCHTFTNSYRGKNINKRPKLSSV